MNLKPDRYYGADYALRAFCDGLEQIEGSHDPQKYLCLFDYIARWVEDGNGIIACSGDFQIYLTTVVLIIDWWNVGRLENFSEVDDDTQFIPRRVVQVADWGRLSSAILDPSYFQFHKVTQRESRDQELRNFMAECPPSKQE